MSEPVAFPSKLNLVHQSIDCSLVVAAAVDLSLAQNLVAELEIGIGHPVWEAAHANPDALQHPVAGQLVHDERGLHLARLLVGVWNEAAYEMRLAVVEGLHQGNQGDKVDGRDGFTTRLLLLLSFFLGRRSWLTWTLQVLGYAFMTKVCHSNYGIRWMFSNPNTNIKIIDEWANGMNLGGPARGGLVGPSRWRIS